MKSPSMLNALLVLIGAGLATHRATGALIGWLPPALLDLPNERSSHVRPTPRGGGLAILLVVLAGGALGALLSGRWRVFWPYFGGALLVGVVSLIDDLRALPRGMRLAVHVSAAMIAIIWYAPGYGFSPATHLAFAVASLVWIVGLTNAYNFMDGIDGLAAAQALIAGLAWALLGLLLALPQIVLLAALVAGAAGGFLLHNRPPARIFMGDVGSAFLGYTFAVLPLMTSGTPRLGAAALVIMGGFVFDTTFTILRRASRGENVLHAHRSHLYQRLVLAGASHARVTGLYSGLAVLAAAAGLAVALAPPRWFLLPLLLAVGGAAGLWLHVRSQERRAAVVGTT